MQIPAAVVWFKGKKQESSCDFESSGLEIQDIHDFFNGKHAF